jgi:hypothetical protein
MGNNPGSEGWDQQTISTTLHYTHDGDLTKKNPKNIMLERNPRLAHLTPAQALASLKSELKCFVDGDDPFDRQFRAGETVRQWWIAVQKKPFGAVLGVHQSLFISFCLSFLILSRHFLSNYIL